MHALGKLRPRAVERRVPVATRNTTTTSARSLVSNRSSGSRHSSSSMDSAAVAAMVRTASRPSAEMPHPASLLPAHPATSGLVQPSSPADERASALMTRRPSISSSGRGNAGISRPDGGSALVVRMAGQRSSSLISGRTKGNGTEIGALAPCPEVL